MKNKKNQNGFVTLVFLVYLIIFAVFITGWVKNIIKFTDCDFESPYKAEVIRGVGIFIAPVGAIAGYLTIDDAPVTKEVEE